METTLAILMVLGIYIVIPAVIGFTIGGYFVMKDRRAKRAEREKSLEEAVAAMEELVAEARPEQPAEVGTHRKTRETTKVA